MDAQTRTTLELIEEVSRSLSPEERGRQLVYVVRDYAEDGDLLRARDVLRQVDEEYFSDHMYRHAVEDTLFGEAVARLIELLGYGFWLLAREAAEA